MQMDTITISLGQYSNERYTALHMAEQIQAARQAGFRVLIKVEHPDGMAVLPQLPVVMEQFTVRRSAMPHLIGLALVVSLAFIFVGIWGLAL
jgi:hypothetical protein